MNYHQLCEIADLMTETAARMIDLASVLRATVNEGVQNKIDWEQLEARIAAEIEQLEGRTKDA